MKDNICFIANYSKTIFFEAVAQKLKKQGKKIFWITVSEMLRSSLSNTWKAENILYLNNAQPTSPTLSDLRLNEIIKSDRALNTQGEMSKKYLQNIQRPIYDFLKNNEIGFVFGEITWGHEILIHRITKQHTELNCIFLNPHTVRIPKSYFGFFSDEQQSILHETTNSNQSQLNLTPEKPSYLKLNDKLIKKHFSFTSRAKRVLNFISRKNYDKTDPTIVHDRFKKILIKTKIELNREAYRFVKKYKYEDIKQKKYILLLLHKQPEASIDVIGRYYDDQYTNILNIWRSLPEEYSLLVKEHSNAIGDRSLFFYKKINNLFDTYLIDENEETYNLILHSEGVVTVSGTAAYESALLGIKSYTFAPVFFNELNLCTNININMLKDTNIFSIKNGSNKQSATDDFSSWLSKRIFEGIISDPISDINCMSEQNISAVSNAFIEITKQTEHHNAH
ncbi:MAG: hypothetical protein ACFWT5_14390 [Pseudomonas helleri]|jgi:hypothetical protein|uniref:hypothetical protein n=1 Tax=Pseudomonas helleri TaxID=1608996 RepID=UPI003A1008E0